MPKFHSLLAYIVTLIIFCHTQLWAATQPQGMDVYGSVTPPKTLDATENKAGGQVNNNGFQTFQVSPPPGNVPAASPPFVQPSTGSPTPQTQGDIGGGTSIRQSIVPRPQTPALVPQGSVMQGDIGQPTPAQLEEMQELYAKGTQSFAQGNYKEALEIWNKLAKEGHAPSMIALGLVYDNGHAAAHIPENTKEALALFRKAADLGHIDGMYHLGRMLVHGRGDAQGKKYPETAAQWFRKAADLGQHDAQYALGVLYESGQGVVRNAKHAVSWYSLAAAGQNVPAQARLGHFYRVGKAVPKNLERAALLLYGATMGGNAAARQELYGMAVEQYGEKKLPPVTLFGLDLTAEKGITRSAMRSALSVSDIKPESEDIKRICDMYNLNPKVPGAKQMAACYGVIAPDKSMAEQELGFVIIDYPVNNEKEAEVIKNMVSGRFGPPTAGEKGRGFMWNLGNVIVATQYSPQNKEVGLMYIIPRVYHMTKGKR